jgi:hypothetical protein
MKQLLTLIFLTLFSTIILAQSGNKKVDELKRHRALVNEMLQSQAKRDVKSKSVKKMESLMAQSTRNNTGDSLIDSVRVMYGSVDTAIYDYNTMVYPYNYPYSTSPMFNNNLGSHTSPQVWFNAYYHWTVDPNTLTYVFYQKEFRNMDFHKEIFKDTALYADSSFIPNMTYANNFNAGNVISSYSFIYQAGVSDSAYKQFFNYAAGKLTKDSTYEYSGGTWHLVSKSFYSYNISNDLIQIDNYANTTDTTFTKPLPEQFQYINSYDGSHRMLTVYAKQYDGANLAPYVADTFAYTGSYNYHTSWKEYQYDGINKYWAPITYMTKQLNVSGLPDTVNIQAFDSLANQWVPYTRDVIKYDSVKNPDSLLDYEYNYVSFPSTPNFTTLYYYNYVTDPNTVNNITGSNNNIRIYPNPAHENITVSGIESKNAMARITLCDMQGRICVKENIVVKNGSFQLPVGRLTSGAYILTIQDAAGAMLGRRLVTKE